MICIHHNKDLDGYSSGAIVKHKYPHCKLIGWDYSEPLPDLEHFREQEVIMIDISFPMEVMYKLFIITGGRLTWIDHHVSAKKDFDAYAEMFPVIKAINYVYDVSVAACEGGWNYLYPGTPMPYAIKLLGQYDTWRQADGGWDDIVLPFQYAMRVECTDPESFPKEMFRTLPNSSIIFDYVNKGIAIVKYQAQGDMLACKRSSFTSSIKGLRAICLNTRAFSSNTMLSVYNPELHDIMVGFEYTGKCWSVSLRSVKPDVDVSIIAKARGGGGHKAAAGFEAQSLEDIFVD